ncbi:hypothetical protein DPMN_149489 [Dreissena polymorpha]|uniref:Uncharacterized protein n=1 Tax=Dreissena polymorpha TaxID=45954 RepID=A0A9D4FCT0_DREPO|nr:hypothetical protein DPMN_149489 [Dreissena polymorpha]
MLSSWSLSSTSTGNTWSGAQCSVPGACHLHLQVTLGLELNAQFLELVIYIYR